MKNVEKYRVIQQNPTLAGLARITDNIVYSENGMVLRVIHPWRCEANENRRYPLILFIQGSAWTSPDMNFEIPQLSRYAAEGYVVATVTHRNCMNDFPFPAFLCDVKCALRYLRTNADMYAIDREKVIAFGTSSGGNTALLLGMTGDDPRYKTHEYADQSDAVSAVVECFGPTDMFDLFAFHKKKDSTLEMIPKLLGGDENTETARKNARDMSPLLIAEAGKEYPPMLIIHGDCDNVVPYETQGEAMFRLLDTLGCDVSLIRVEGADHEGAFWSRELHGMIIDFMNTAVK